MKYQLPWTGLYLATAILLSGCSGDSGAPLGDTPSSLPGLPPASTSKIDYFNAKVKLTTYPDFIFERPDFDSTGRKLVGDLRESVLPVVGGRVGNNGTDQIYTADFDGVTGTPSNLQCLTCDQVGPNGLAKWSPDNKKILFHSQRTRNPGAADAGAGFPFDDVWVMNADGSNPTQLTFGTLDAANFHGVWAPDGKKIAWIHHECTFTCPWQLMVADFVDGETPRLENARKLSPDGDTSFWETQDFLPNGLLMVTITAEGLLNGESHLVDINTGERVKRMTQNRFWDEQFHPSPDGNFIIQMSTRDNPGNSTVQGVPYDQGLPPALDYVLAGPFALTFQFEKGPKSDLYLYGVDEGDQKIRRLTFVGDDGQVVPEFGWSPDGRHVAWGARKIVNGRQLQILGLQILTFE